MAKYKVIHIFKYTEEAEIEAESEKQALERALQHNEWDRQNDDYLFDAKCKLLNN